MDAQLWFAVAILLPVGLFLFAARRSERSGFLGASPVSVADAPDGGTGCVVGRVAADRTITPPCSDRQVVAWHVRVWEAGPGATWTRIADAREAVAFRIVDGDASAFVDVEHLRPWLTTRYDSGQVRPNLREVRRMMGEIGAGNIRATWPVRYVIRTLEVGDVVAARGHMTREIDPRADLKATGYRGAERATRVVARGTARDPLRVTNLPGPLPRHAISKRLRRQAA